MNTVLSLILLIAFDSIRDDSTRSIALYILDHIDTIQTLSIQKIADACYVSTNSVIKFCHTIGFERYAEFKKRLKSTIETRRLQLVEKYYDLSLDTILEKMSGFAQDEDPAQIKQEIITVSRKILQNKELHFYGAMFPLALSLSFAEDCLVLGIKVHFHQTKYDEEIIDKPEDGVHLIVTFSGRWIETRPQDVLQIAKNEQVILISQSYRKLPEIEHKIVLPSMKSPVFCEVYYMLLLDGILSFFVQERLRK